MPLLLLVFLLPLPIDDRVGVAFFGGRRCGC